MTIPVTWLDETQVNTTPLMANEIAPRVIQLANGNLLVAWSSNINTGAGAAPGTDAIGRLFNPIGEPIGEEFRLNVSHSLNNELLSDIAALPSGGFVVVYEDYVANIQSLYLDTFTAEGVAIVGSSPIIESLSTSSFNAFAANVTPLNSGEVFIAYTNFSQAATAGAGRIYDTVTGNVSAPTVLSPAALIDTVALADGNVAILRYSRPSGFFGPTLVAFEVRTPSGNIVSTGVVDPSSGLQQGGDAAIVALDGGGFAIAYSQTLYVRSGLAVRPGSYNHVVRSYDSLGVQTGNGDFSVVVNQFDAETPALAAQRDGGFQFVYRNFQGNLVATDFSETAQSLGQLSFATSQVRFNSDTVSPTALGLLDGRTVVLWEAHNGTVNSISLEILDTRSVADTTPIYSVPGQFGTVGDDLITLAVGSTYIAASGGNDTLIGALTAGRLIGGAGDDTYIVQTERDTIVEQANGGRDIVRTSTLHLDIPTNVEDALFTGTGTTIIGGNTLNNRITGGVSYDVLVGFGGNDTLVGGTGAANELIGGIGDDVYVSNAIGDSIVELAGGGIDRIETALPIYVLRNQVENLLYNGSAGFLGIGNELDNVITGGIARDDLYGRNGNDIITGGAGAANTLLGNVGDDIFIVAAVGDSVVEYGNEGTDRVETALASFRLPTNVEQLTYTGTGDFIGFGSDGDNIITGRAGADSLFGFGGNDRLISGVGAADTLVGGSGDDVYVTNIGSSIVELANEGVDTIEVIAVNYTITAANVEILRYVGLNDFRGTGNDLDNVIHGAGGNDILRGLGGADLIFGNAGNDQIYGGSGAADTLFGGLGNDVYYIDVAGTSVLEGVNEGRDQIATTTNSFILPENVEVLRYIGGSGFTGTGSNGNDIISGGGLSDTLSGGFGDDVIVGKSGADTLSGGAGIDQFRYNGGELGNDRILDFTPGTDKIALATPSLDDAGFNRTVNLALVQGAGANAASSADATFIYDSVSGLLSYDADGSRVGGIIALAVLPTGLTLSIGDFLFV